MNITAAVSKILGWVNNSLRVKGWKILRVVADPTLKGVVVVTFKVGPFDPTRVSKFTKATQLFIRLKERPSKVDILHAHGTQKGQTTPS